VLRNRIAPTPLPGLLAAALLAAAFALPAAALEGESCPTWFPDFRCDRSGRWDGFVAPMQMPYLFEDPFITTGLQLVGIYHEYPGHSLFGGGHLGVLALQARVALTDRLAFIATKDGYVWHRPDDLPNEDGFFDISMGLKYALFQNEEENWIVSPSFRIDIPAGQKRVYSGNGDGVGIPAVSAAWGWGDFHVLGDFGARFPFDMNAESTSLFWNLHFDYALFEHFVPLFEVGGMHWTGHGTKIQAPNPPGSFEGVDVVNLGVRSVTGNGIVIVTFGARFPITKHLSFGGSYGIPATDRDDIWKQRATMSLLLEF
jgi:hypothetical protein